jgi:hypothetical protein
MGRAGSFRSSPNIVSSFDEVLICVAILHEFARHSSHKAEDDFPYSNKVLELGYDPFIYIRDSKSSVVEL